MPPRTAKISSLRALSRLYAPHASRTLRALRTLPTPTQSLWKQPLSISFQRFNTTSSHARPLTDRTASTQASQQPQRPPQPEYEMTFTCKPCGTRSTHRVSKQGYHFGSTLITCPECRNRHIISDNLNIFGDKSITIEDLMREQGQLVKRGTLSEDGDLEFWDDGSTTKRVKSEVKDEVE